MSRRITAKVLVTLHVAIQLVLATLWCAAILANESEPLRGWWGAESTLWALVVGLSLWVCLIGLVAGKMWSPIARGMLVAVGPLVLVAEQLASTASVAPVQMVDLSLAIVAGFIHAMILFAPSWLGLLGSSLILNRGGVRTQLP